MPEGIGVACDPPGRGEPQQEPCDEQQPETTRRGSPRRWLRRVSVHVSGVRERADCY
jgi:hypothetical protein